MQSEPINNYWDLLSVFVLVYFHYTVFSNLISLGSSIRLLHDQRCYFNGSYFYDDDIRPEPLKCVLPKTTLNGGQWVIVNGSSSVDCSTNHLRCNNVSLPDATLSLNIPIGQGITSSDDGWYKCCLPTNCSDPDTNVIFANIFSK